MNEHFRNLLSFVVVFAFLWGLGQLTLPLGTNGMIVVQGYFAFVIMILLAIAFRVSTEPTPNEKTVPSGTKALELLADNVKQVLTLTTALIAITTTLGVYNKFAWSAPDIVKWMLIGSLGTYFLSIFIGLIAHGAIVDIVHQAECKLNEANIYDKWAEFLMRAQQVLFVVGLFLTLTSGAQCFFFEAAKNSENKPEDKNDKPVSILHNTRRPSELFAS